jgi:ZIP family zinc transporter
MSKLVADHSGRMDQPVFHWANLGGFLVGIAAMYFTAFLVKF